MINKIKQIEKIISVSAFSLITYYIGYISTDFHNNLIGINIDYSVIDILKWSADFIIYSFIDLIKHICNLFIEHKYIIPFYIYIFSTIILFTLKKCDFINGEKKAKIFNILFLLLTSFIIYISIYHINLIFKSDIKKEIIDLLYQKLNGYDNFIVLYQRLFFIVLLLSVLTIKLRFKLWKINKVFIIVGLLLLPPMYGIYGRSYYYPEIKTKTDKNLLVLIENYNNFYYIYSWNSEIKTSSLKIIKTDSLNYSINKPINVLDKITE